MLSFAHKLAAPLTLVFLEVPRRCLTLSYNTVCQLFPSQVIYCSLSYIPDSFVNVLCSLNYLKNLKCPLVPLFIMRTLISLLTLKVPEGCCEHYGSRMLWFNLFYATFSSLLPPTGRLMLRTWIL